MQFKTKSFTHFHLRLIHHICPFRLIHHICPFRLIYHIFFFTFCFNYCTAQDTSQHIIAGRTNSAEQQQKPYLILISADGFRYDMADKFQASHLLRLRDAGIAAAYMQPSFPSLTFPNHYTIVTGLYPAHHGLADNIFFDTKKQALYDMNNKTTVADGSWYGGTPIWVLAEQQHMLSASFYWVASEAPIQGTQPSYFYNYNEDIAMDTRIHMLKKWLQLPADKRPHFITFYFPEVDDAAHKYGPDSEQAGQAVHFIDQSVGKMVAAIDSLQLPVNFIFVSDHGMANVDTAALTLPSYIDTTKFFIPSGDALVHLYAKNKKDVMPAYKLIKKQAVNFDVYLADNTPLRWHYRKKDDLYNRMGDLLLVPKPPNMFSLNGKRIKPGKHGYDPFLKDMHAVFYAWGPAFKHHLKIGGFENVHVYPLMAKILGLSYTQPVDGRLSVLEPILK